MKPTQDGYFHREVCRPFFLEGSEKGILLVHGFTGSVAHMRKLGDALGARGYTVQGINLPGHATDEARMAKSGWQQWLQAVRDATEALRQRCNTVTVCGLSMGGVLALMMAEEQRADVCVTISAPMAVKNKLMPLAKWVAPLKPRVSWRPHKGRSVALDQRYDFGYTGFPTAKAEDLHQLIRMARGNLALVQCPLLCVQSKGDQTIWAGSSGCILSGIGSQAKQALWLEDAPHVCTLASELPAIVEGMDAFIRASGRSSNRAPKIR